MSGVSRFDCYPSDFLNGVIGLTGDEIAAYTVVLMLQYDRGRPVAYKGRERELAVRSGLPKKRLSQAIEKLLEVGKLAIADGALFNGRAALELEKISQRIQKNTENSQLGGISTREKWIQKRNEINGNEGRPAGRPAGRNKALLSPPSALPPPPINRDADASLANAPAPAIESPIEDLIKLDVERDKLAEARREMRSLAERWNSLASGLRLPQIEEIKAGSPREKSALARIREHTDFDRVFTKIRGSPFLRGESGRSPATFDWITNPTNLMKILEGNYDENREKRR